MAKISQLGFNMWLFTFIEEKKKSPSLKLRGIEKYCQTGTCIIFVQG